MELISIPASLTSTRIFPDLYENDESVFYHGTSEIYSNQIEQFGLFPNHKPITTHFYSLFNFAQKVYTFTSENDNDFSTFNNSFKDARGYFNEFTRISFSAISYSAAFYSIGTMAGGQCLRHLIKIKTELSKINFSLLEYAYINISEFEKHNYETIIAEIEKIRSSNGVVYAFRFDSNDKTHLSYEKHTYHSVLLSCSHIFPSKIVAKMIIPNGIQLNQTLIDESHNKTMDLSHLSHTTPFIRDLIFYNLERNDIKSYFNPL
jgi:hypothetical protein